MSKLIQEDICPDGAAPHLNDIAHTPLPFAYYKEKERSLEHMAITSLDILNLSHSLKDVCSVDCNTPACLSQTLKLLLQYNLIQANLQFSRQFEGDFSFPLTETEPTKQGTGLDLTNPNFTHRTDNHQGTV